MTPRELARVDRRSVRQATAPIDEAMESFGNALRSRQGERLTLMTVRIALRRLCVAARHANVYPEQLLIRLKETLDSLPELQV